MLAGTPVLLAVSQPPQRLFVAQKALPLSLGGGFLLAQIIPEGLALLGWALLHGTLAVFTRRDPYFIAVWQAYGKQRRFRKCPTVRGESYDI